MRRSVELLSSYLVEHLALVGDTLREYHIKG